MAPFFCLWEITAVSELPLVVEFSTCLSRLWFTAGEPRPEVSRRLRTGVVGSQVVAEIMNELQLERVNFPVEDFRGRAVPGS